MTRIVSKTNRKVPAELEDRWAMGHRKVTCMMSRTFQAQNKRCRKDFFYRIDELAKAIKEIDFKDKIKQKKEQGEGKIKLKEK